MLRRLFCAVLSAFSINPFLRPAPAVKVEVSQNFKMATIFVDEFINKIEHYQNKEGVKLVYYDSFQVWDDPHVKKQERIGWYAWVETNHRRYRDIGISVDAHRSLFSKPDESIEKVMDLIVAMIREYSLYGIKPQHAQKYKEEFNGIED